MRLQTENQRSRWRRGQKVHESDEAGILVRNLAKSYVGNEAFAVRNFSVDVKSGEFLVLLGASGCGKTTVLRSIAGLERIDGGEIHIGGEVASAPTRGVFWPPERRRLGMVFQSYAIWPHMKVKTNIAYPLRCRGWKRSVVDAEVESTLSLVGLEGLADRYPNQLSGGQQQRVALARALIAHPTAMLFDEPLSNLDAKLRAQMRVELGRLHQKLGFTAIYVTHDLDEAMLLGDRIAVMQDGEIEQMGTPDEVYRQPRNRFVSEFLGVTNYVPGVVVTAMDRAIVVESSLGRIEAPPPITPVEVGSKVLVCIRPSAVRIAQHDDAYGCPGRVAWSRFLGDEWVGMIRAGDVELDVKTVSEALPPDGTDVRVVISGNEGVSVLVSTE